MGIINIDINCRYLVCFFVFFSFSLESQESGLKLIDKGYNSFVVYENDKLWISSEGGWNSYDGESVEQYFMNDEAKTLLGTFIQNKFIKDKNQILWSSTYNYLCCFDPKLDAFSSFQPIVDGNIIDHEIRLIDYDVNTHSILFRGNESICKYDIAKERTTVLSSEDKTHGVVFLNEKNSEEIEFYASPYILGQYLEYWSMEDTVEKKLKIDFSLCNNILSSALISEMFYIGDDICLLSNVGLIKLNKKSPCNSSIYLEGYKLIKSVIVDGIIIMTSHELGLVLFDVSKGKLVATLDNKSEALPLLSNNPIEIAFENNELIISYRDIGIQRVNLSRLKTIIEFGNEITPVVKSTKILSNDSSLVFLNDKREVFQYDENGLLKLDLSIEPTMIYIQDSELYVANDSEIWSWNLETMTSKFLYKSLGFKIQEFSLTDNSKPYFIASENIYNLKGANITSDSLSFIKDQSTHFAKISSNKNIISTTSDIFIGNAANYTKIPTSSYIYDMHYSIDKEEFLLALGDGLGIVDLNTNILQKKSIHGHSVDEIIDFYNQGYLLRTPKGLYHLSADYDTLKLITPEEVSSCALFQDKLIYAAESGIHTIDKQEIAQDIQDAIFIKSSTVPYTKNGEAYTFEYGYKDPPLEIDITSTQIKNNEIGTYTYQIENYNTSLQENRIREDIKLPILPEGKYHINIQGYKSDRTKANELKVHINVKGPFWRQWWFYLSSLIFISLLIWKYFSVRTKRLLHDAKMAEEIRQLEKSALQAQMNPHFIFNCLNSIQSFIMDNDKENAMDYLGKFAQLIRANLNASIEPKISLFDEIRILENYLSLEQLRLNKKFEFSIDCASDIDVYETYIPPMLIQPFAENAVIHGMRGVKEKGVISIKFSKINTGVAVSIVDNGQLMEQKERVKTHKSVGVDITKKRLAHINQSNADIVNVNIDHRVEGTIVSLTIATTI